MGERKMKFIFLSPNFLSALFFFVCFVVDNWIAVYAMSRSSNINSAASIASEL